MAKKRQIAKSPSLSVKSIGMGEIERVAGDDSPVSKDDPIINQAESQDDPSFVVRNFRALTSKWLQCNDSAVPNSPPALTKETNVAENDTLGVRTTSDSSLSEGVSGEEGTAGKEEIIYDLSTDLAYHNSSEVEGADLVRQALTPEEESLMPDDFMPLRHYRAEKGDVDKAIVKIKNTLKWRKEFDVDKLVSALENDKKKKPSEEDEVDYAAILREENETGKIYVRGYDKDGRAMMYMRPGRENTMDEDNNMRHLVFQLEKAVACSTKNGHGKICLVIDYDGFAISKTPPMSASKRTLNILQDHFCERMYRAYICNPPFVFRSFYAMIKPFVDPVTKQKVCWCVGKKGLDQVVEDVGGPEKAEGQLEKCFGGAGNIRSFDSVEYNLLPLNVAFDEK